MGISFSCPFSVHSDLENALESITVKSINFGDDDQKTPVRSISFKSHDSEPTIQQSVGSGKMVKEGSVSFKRGAEMMNSTESWSIDIHECSKSTGTDNRMVNQILKGSMPLELDTSSPKHEAATKLQKVYKSFRTRRKLADCAVLIEQSWWKLLDFAELKHSSISFFDLDKHETAISRWSRARTRAAKVGKGLSKNGKAQKLALQHWLEAIDPRHRYGHNLHFYYVKWLQSQSKQPFFYWLDIGEGKEVNLVEKCPRSKLQQQCIKYLGPMERKAYEVAVEEGKLFYRQSGVLLDTTGEPKGAKRIFVLSTSRILYVGKKKKGTFQHSSFLAGGATLAAGRIVAEDGILKAVWPHSGHYRPTPENFQDFLLFLRENDVDLTDVKLDSADEEESAGEKSLHIRSNSSEDEKSPEKDSVENGVEDAILDDLVSTEETAAMDLPESRPAHTFSTKLTNLEIPSKDDLLARFAAENLPAEPEPYPPLDGYDSSEEAEQDNKQQTPSHEEHDETEESIIPEESILRRINSHKETKSFQLGKQLSSRWCTGAGPRIGCVRDYPSELQSHALEQVNLSPRSSFRLRLNFTSRASTPTGVSPLVKSSSSRGSCHHSRSQS